MKDDTTARNINGTWYLRLPPSFARHLELNGEGGDGYNMQIQDELGRHGKYISAWKN